jgi:hypothetical protein
MSVTPSAWSAPFRVRRVRGLICSISGLCAAVAAAFAAGATSAGLALARRVRKVDGPVDLDVRVSSGSATVGAAGSRQSRFRSSLWSYAYLVLGRILALIVLLGRSREAKEIEILVLRHQLEVRRAVSIVDRGCSQPTGRGWPL